MNRHTLIQKCSVFRTWKSVFLIPICGLGALTLDEAKNTLETSVTANTSLGACWMLYESDWFFYDCPERFTDGSSCSSSQSNTFRFSCPEKSKEKPTTEKEGSTGYTEGKLPCPRGYIVWCNIGTLKWLKVKQPAGTVQNFCTGTYGAVLLNGIACKDE